jgi:hypothetical protein
MRVTRRRLRKGVCCLALLSAAGGGVATFGAGRASAQDADAYVFSAGVTFDNLDGTPPASGAYSFGTSACAGPGGLPGFVDVPSDEMGPCSVNGKGNLLAAGCTTGAISADWAFTEPRGDTASFKGDGVVVGGVAIIAGSPNSVAPGTGYWDDASAGSAVGIGVFVPDVGNPCPIAASPAADLTAVVVGAY